MPGPRRKAGAPAFYPHARCALMTASSNIGPFYDRKQQEKTEWPGQAHGQARIVFSFGLLDLGEAPAN